MIDLTKRERNVLIGFLIVFILGMLLLQLKRSSSFNWIGLNNFYTSFDKHSSDIWVLVKGEVAHPGVYPISADSSLKDVLALAQPLPSVDLNEFNIEEKLVDGQIINLHPKIKNKLTQLLNLNHATKDELIELPGVGVVFAQRIINYRQEHPFQNIHDLMNVPGIGEKRFEKIKRFIIV